MENITFNNSNHPLSRLYHNPEELEGKICLLKIVIHKQKNFISIIFEFSIIVLTFFNYFFKKIIILNNIYKIIIL